MAQFFPTRSTCRFDTSGERRLAERLEKKLEDDYLCWYNVPVGPKALQPDFIVLHPQRGFLVLEVKDWKLDTIQTMDRDTAQIFDGGQLKPIRNPMMQARHYAIEVTKVLAKDAALKEAPGTPRAGSLITPYGWGVVLTKITRKQFETTNLGEVLDPQRVICQDEMSESVEDEAFQQRLWDMFYHVFPCRLTLPQIDRVRYHLFPEVRVNTQSGQFGLPFAEDANALPSLIKVMDLQQEQLARSLGEGHRVIHGAAGSGKTMILGYRAAYLAKATTKPVLVLCFNRSLAGRLQQVMDQRGLGDKVSARTFHSWCMSMLRAYNVDLPPKQGDDNAWYAAIVEKTIDSVDRGQIPRAQYAAVLIDEGHDFAPEWFKLVVQMIDPDTNSLLVLYDDAQSIYGNKRGLDFSFASVGIQAQGRTTILRLNYRNTVEVLSVARAFATELLAEREGTEDGIPVVSPESAGRRGAFPELIRCESDWQERDCIVERIRDEHGQGRAYSDMAVLYRTNARARQIESALQKVGIPYASAAAGSRGKSELYGDADTVKIVSMHSSKGLEFGFVLIPFLGEMPRAGEPEADEARLLYVAMTRAIDRLVMTYREPSDFTRRIQDSIAGVKERLAAADGMAA